MNAQRYAAYREVLRSLETLSLRDGEIEVLRDAAEGYLLAPDENSDELAELGLGVSIVLDRAADSRRVTQQTVNELTAAIEASGPRGIALLAV